MEMNFTSRMSVEQIAAVHKKKLHYRDRKYYLSGEVSTEKFSFTVGSFHKQEELPRFVFSGTVGEKDGKAEFLGNLVKTELTQKTDKITAFSLSAAIGALSGILVQLLTGKWYYSVAALLGGGLLGIFSHFRSTKKERKSFAIFFTEYMKKIFRATPKE